MTFYFYDLETSGVSAKYSRIVQFGGLRTDENLQQIGETDEMCIRLSRDVLPEPDAVLLTGITPQKTLAEGLTEAEFMRYFETEIAMPDTVFIGFNNIRFDDEFMRYTHYRNYYDAYEWQWKDGRSRWDLLDATRMVRALRPEGLKWPHGADGVSVNRLESLTSENGIDHAGAHTALADVKAMVELARKIKAAQPKIFDYLLAMRDKKKIKELVSTGSPFMYTSGSFESRYEKTTIAVSATELPDKSGAIVFDARYDPKEWESKSDDELREAMNVRYDDPMQRLPFKALQYNRCPAVAPLSVLDEKSAKRLSLDVSKVQEHIKTLRGSPELIARIAKLFEEKKASYQTALLPDESNPDTRLYDDFVPDADKREMKKIHNTKPADLATFNPSFEDGRLKGLWPLYKARNYPKSLSDSERATWEKHVQLQVFEGGERSRFNLYLQRIEELGKSSSLTKDQQYLLEELKLYGESLVPSD